MSEQQTEAQDMEFDGHKLPPQIAEAVASIMDKVPKLDKKHKNEHGKFMFASIDDFLEAVGPLMAGAGLLIIPDEESVEMIHNQDSKGADTSWIKVKYSFTLSHKSGETWVRRPKRTAFVRASMGPQAMGAAQSYAQKQFERSLFHIPTGDAEDTDAHNQGRLPSRQPVHGELNKTKLQAALRAFDRDLHRCTDLSEMDGVLASYKDTLEQCERDLPGWWHTQANSDVLGIEDRIANMRSKLEKEAAPEPSSPDTAPSEDNAERRRIEASLRACKSTENIDAFWAIPPASNYHDDVAMEKIYLNLRAMLAEKEEREGKPEETGTLLDAG